MKDFFTIFFTILILGICIKITLFICKKLFFTNFLINFFYEQYRSFLKILNKTIKLPFIILKLVIKLIKITIFNSLNFTKNQSSNLIFFTKSLYENHKEKLKEIKQEKLKKSSIPNNERIEFIKNICTESLLRINISKKNISHKNLTDGKRYSFEIELQRLNYQISSIKGSIKRFKEKPSSQQEIQQRKESLLEIQESSLSIPKLLSNIEKRILTIMEEDYE